jgi:hypothetical protein
MRILAGTALALLLAVGSARAEDAVAPQRVALAKQVMELSGATKLYDNYDKNLDTMLVQLRQSMPNLDDATAADIKKMAVEEFNASKPEMIEGTATIYARHFSERDLKALVAFYKSDAGQHFTTELPAVMTESMQLMAPFNKRFYGRLQQYIADKIAAQAAEHDKSKDKKDK